MATNSPIELLIALGVSDKTSRSNITTYLDNLKKDLKLDIELNASSSKGNGFDNMRKEIESLQKQVTELNKQLTTVGSGKVSPTNISQGIKKEVIESIKSLEQLEKHIKNQNGDIKLKFSPDDKGVEKLQTIITRVKTGLNEIQEVKIKPVLDPNGVVIGLKQIDKSIHDVSSKDLNLNINKATQELNKLARQGELSKDQFDKFRNSISSSINNTELNKVLETMRNINKETSHENKMQNSMQNINKQAIDLSTKLNQFAKDKNNAFDPVVIDKFLNKLDRLAGSNFSTVKGMKTANSDFTSVEKEINAYIKLQDKYKDVTNNLQTLQRQGKITSADFANFEKDAKLATTTTELSRLNKEINNFSKNTKIDSQVANAFNNISKEVDTLNGKLKNVTLKFDVSKNPLLSQVTSDISKISNMKIETPKDIEKLNNLISATSKNIKQLGTDGNNLSQFNNKVREVTALMSKMSESGLLTSKEISKFSNSLSRIDSGNLLHVNNLLTQMSNKFDKLKTSQKNVDTFEKQKNSLERLNSELTRTEKLFPRALNTQANKDKLTELRNEINKFQNMPIMNETSLKNNQKEIDRLKEKVKQFSAETTQAARGSSGVIDSFKVAMERFPIWMAASTAFYGTVRTAKEFFTILVDIDTKLVSIQKVTGDGTDMGAIFDRATESAERFGQSISQALDAYIEFARQGYKGDELGILADAGLIASNVGEITAQQASEYMTALN